MSLAGGTGRLCHISNLQRIFSGRVTSYPGSNRDQRKSSRQYTDLAAWLVLSVDNMKTSLSGREPLNGAAEPGLDLLEIDVFDVTESVRAKNCCNASRLETAGPTFIQFLKLFGPLRH